MDTNAQDLCDVRIGIARLDEKIKASDKALELARNSLSRNGVLSVITVIISIISIIFSFVKH